MTTDEPPRKRRPISLYGDTVEDLIKVKGILEQREGKIKSLDKVLKKLIEFWKDKNDVN